MSDEEAEKYLKIFTFLTKEEIEALAEAHKADPGLRPLQKKLAEEVTVMVHGRDAYDAAVEASKILFGNNTADALKALDEATLLDVLDGVPRATVAKEDLEAGIPLLDLLAVKTDMFPSKGEARKMVQQGGFSLNKVKLTDPQTVITKENQLNDKYLLLQRGKKNYMLVVSE